jgi:hypothetical protein
MRAQYIYESNENLTPGQKYAVDFLKPIGLILVSNPKQLKRGTLIFRDTINKWTGDHDRYWGIYKTGYIRTGYQNRIDAIDRIRPAQYEKRGFIDDEDYMELAHLVSEKIRKITRTEKKRNPLGLKIKVEGGLRVQKDGYKVSGTNIFVSFEDVKLLINKLKKEGFKNNITIYKDTSQGEGRFKITGEKSKLPTAFHKAIYFNPNNYERFTSSIISYDDLSLKEIIDYL